MLHIFSHYKLGTLSAGKDKQDEEEHVYSLLVDFVLHFSHLLFYFREWPIKITLKTGRSVWNTKCQITVFCTVWFLPITLNTCPIWLWTLAVYFWHTVTIAYKGVLNDPNPLNLQRRNFSIRWLCQGHLEYFTSFYCL